MPLTTRPSDTSRHGITRTATVMPTSLRSDAAAPGRVNSTAASRSPPVRGKRLSLPGEDIENWSDLLSARSSGHRARRKEAVMATTSLPSRPDLERFRRDARELQRAVRTGHAGAIHLVAAHHPGGAPTDPAAFPLSAAQLVTARRYGLSSWPKLVAYLQVSRVWSRDPVTVLDDSLAPADEFAALACLTYSDLDDPQRWHRAAARLRNDPALPARSLAAAAGAGDPDALQRHLIEQPATAEVGPFGWVPLLYVVYSRIPQRDPLGTVKLLLEAGADPDSGYLWLGLPTPFTGLTGCFGEGEQG